MFPTNLYHAKKPKLLAAKEEHIAMLNFHAI